MNRLANASNDSLVRITISYHNTINCREITLTGLDSISIGCCIFEVIPVGEMCLCSTWTRLM